jgi:hypothetical protein
MVFPVRYELDFMLQSSGQSSWLQIQRSGFDSWHYQTFWEVVGLKRGPLSLVSTTEELLETKSSGYGLERREYGRRDPSRWPRGTLYPLKSALISPISGDRLVGIIRSRTQATELVIRMICWSTLSSHLNFTWTFRVSHIKWIVISEEHMPIFHTCPFSN